MHAGKPILITGSHRSGSTWTGRMIAASPEVIYLQEPFNNHYFNPGSCSYYFEEPFQYITAENGAEFYPHLRRTVDLKYNLLAGLEHAQDWQQYILTVSEQLKFGYGRLRGKRALFKDPFAVFSAPWLAQEFDMDVIILIRHPAAFVSSVKRMQWESPVWMMRQRDDLMRDYLHPLCEEMDRFLAQRRTIVEQAAFFWKLIYYAVYQNQQQFPDWYTIRHEDLSQEPITGFQKIFDYLSLAFTETVQKTIQEYTHAKNPHEAPKQQTIYRLNSSKNVANWKHRLTNEEVEQIKRLSSGVWQHFYSEEDW